MRQYKGAAVKKRIHLCGRGAPRWGFKPLQKGCVEDMWVRGWVSKPLQKGCVEDMWVRGWASKALQKGCVEDMWVRGWDSKQKGCVRVSNPCRRGLLRTCGSEGGC